MRIKTNENRQEQIKTQNCRFVGIHINKTKSLRCCRSIGCICNMKISNPECKHLVTKQGRISRKGSRKISLLAKRKKKKKKKQGKREYRTT